MRPSNCLVGSEFLKKHNSIYAEKLPRRGKLNLNPNSLEKEVEALELDTERYQEFYDKLYYNYFKEPHELIGKTSLIERLTSRI